MCVFVGVNIPGEMMPLRLVLLIGRGEGGNGVDL